MDKVVAVIVFALIISGWFFIWSSKSYNKNLPIEIVSATIGSKRIDKWKSSTNSPVITEYFVEFDYLERRIELKVNKMTDYERLMVGEIGTDNQENSTVL